MKTKHTAQSGLFNRQLVLCATAACSIITGTLLAFIRTDASTRVSHPAATGLTFAQRVAYQRAIEEVYWRHRIWPRSRGERPDAKPSVDAVMSQAQLESKVHDYLRKSQALQDYWQQPITSEQLQAEMNRMAKHSKQPEVLRKLFQALGNDPFVIAECLARPVLADRLVTKLQNEEGVQVTTVAWLRDPPRSGMSTAETQAPKKVAAIDSIAKAVQVNRPYRLPALASPSDGCIDDTWTPTSTENVPDARASNTAVWTGSEMIVWGGEYGWASLNDGGRYNPNTNTWTTPSTTSDGRYLHTAVWTGSEMIVWGGAGDINFWSTGGRYHPASDSWTATSTLNAPAARSEHTAVWTGSEMIVWGGQVGWDYFNTGGRYCGQTAPPPRSIPTPRPRCSPAPRP